MQSFFFLFMIIVSKLDIELLAHRLTYYLLETSLSGKSSVVECVIYIVWHLALKHHNYLLPCYLVLNPIRNAGRRNLFKKGP